jgi:hypothetical protein
MQRFSHAAAAALLLLGSGAAVHGQQSIQWKQTLNTPKGLSLPSDVKGDILGVELGDTYAEVKPKLQKLLSEARPQSKSSATGPAAEIMGLTADDPIREATMQMMLQVPGGNINVTYPAQLTLTREMKGGGNRPIHDSLEVTFSAPSSGQQVTGMKRAILYFEQTDQARVSELIAALKAKYKAEPQRVNQFTYRFVFDDGRTYVPATVDPANGCRSEYLSQGQMDPSNINRSGKCDVVLDVEVKFGISNDHAEMVTFRLSDNERAKRNMTADVAFLQNYVRDMQSRTGSTPKL